MTLLNMWATVVGLIGTSTAISLWLRSTTKDLDEDLSVEKRKDWGDMLLKGTSSRASWMRSFQHLFSRVFGERHLSWLCVRRSLAISGLLFVFIGLVTGPFRLDATPFRQVGYSPLFVWAVWFLGLTILGVLYNGVIDYLTLWIMRVVINSRLSMMKKIAVGFVATLVIVYALFLISVFALTYLGLSVALLFDDHQLAALILLPFVLLTTQFFDFPPRFGNLAFVVFATSFAPIFWLIVHVLSAILIKFVPRIFSVLDVRNKPIRAIGLVAATLIWLIGLLNALVYAVFLEG
jgi:hypothetical protein